MATQRERSAPRARGPSVTRRTVTRRAAFLLTTACLALVAGCGLLPGGPGNRGLRRPVAADPRSRSRSARTTSAALTPDHQRMEQGAPAASGSQPLYLPQAANGQLAQIVADLQAKQPPLRRDRHGRRVDGRSSRASGWIIPLTPAFPPATSWRPAVDTATYEGRLYAVPVYSNADLLYYRRTW